MYIFIVSLTLSIFFEAFKALRILVLGSIVFPHVGVLSGVNVFPVGF